MMIYRVVSDDAFGELLPDWEWLLQQSSVPDAVADAIFDRSKLAQFWVKHEGLIQDDLPLGDICRLQTSELMLSQKAVECLKEMLPKELLPVTCQEDSWYLLNIINSIPANEKASQLNDYGEVKAIAFNKKDLAGQVLWSSPFSENVEVYCSQTFVDTVKAYSLTGLSFENL
ncbi:hypothetical protein M3P05_05220 [Sansalvadorimonas sp. 2012CJ34-2]|uniref:DUF4123 domain-containing protein n=1 Tax=Parendozoicomonas callyspongiae TaxID=2942213 RepID=A0ABT0PD95_9GAMM|nr:hypothetical protein [Sansalvadorimonas sp. 2012CJ34-2]MCL6269345.1 hypothetical protein [Sansalvadorimonas sp. 2012CJ34-2]